MGPCSNRPLTPAQEAIVARALALIAAAEKASLSGRARSHEGSSRAALAALRDDYREAQDEDRASILAEMHREAARREAAARSATQRTVAPYAGHMRVRVAGRTRDVVLGDRSLIDATLGAAVIDWRKAPLAEVFFTCDPGDDYAIETEDRTVSGVLEAKYLWSFEGGVLTSIGSEGGTLRRDGEAWSFEPGDKTPALRIDAEALLLEARGKAPRVSALLDPDQVALLERSAEEPLLILGSAGCGKTTVALHRVAALCQGPLDPSEVLVVVPEKGLAHLASRLLSDLGVSGGKVSTFDDFIRAESRRVFPRLPAAISPDAPAGVLRLKRHPALLVAMEVVLDDAASAIARRIDHLLGDHGEVFEALRRESDPILLTRLRRAEKSLAKGLSEKARARLAAAFAAERKKLSKVRAEHLRLVGDRVILRRAVEASGGELSPRLIEEVAAHTRAQLDESSEVRFAHVDASRLATLDGRSLDDGTPDAVAATLDVEDHALLLELLFRKTGATITRSGALSRFRHVVLDEAQELAPVELRVLGRVVDPKGGSLTVAGDAAQQIDAAGPLTSWDDAMRSLGHDAKPAFLETSYRSARPIIELAHAVLGPQAPAKMPRVVREGAPVALTTVTNEMHAAAIMIQALGRLIESEPRARVAVLAADARSARSVHEALLRGLSARLVEDGAFTFAAGIEVTHVAEAKGLEFDVVVIPDATAAHYPDSPASRRRLHVAATRAAQLLWIVSPGPRSPLLPEALGEPSAALGA